MKTYFIATEGLPYQQGNYPDITPTLSFIERHRKILSPSWGKTNTTPTEDGYVETHFHCKEHGNSVIKHLP
jgi:hypothetical protein